MKVLMIRPHDIITSPPIRGIQSPGQTLFSRLAHQHGLIPGTSATE